MQFTYDELHTLQNFAEERLNELKRHGYSRTETMSFWINLNEKLIQAKALAKTGALEQDTTRVMRARAKEGEEQQVWNAGNVNLVDSDVAWDMGLPREQ